MAITKTEGGEQYPASAYLVVEDPQSPSTWHLRVRDASGAVDHRLLGASWAALHGGYRGNQYEGPNKQEAISKLRKIYESEGMTVPSEKETKDMGTMMTDEPWPMFPGPTTIADAIAQEQAQEQAEQLQDAFGTFQQVVSNIMASPEVADKGAAIEKEAGAFRQLLDSIIGAAKAIAHKVMGDAPKPVEQTPAAPAAFTLFKDAAGAWRWLAIATNNRRDSDHPAQILTEAAHKEFLQYLDAHPDAMPELWHWHTPGTKWGRADFADYADGFMVYAGTVEAGHEAEAEKLSKQKGLGVGADYFTLQKEIGVSHGFVVLDHDRAQEYITKYRTFEVSPLPLSAAANRWTNFQTIHKEVGMPFADQKRAYLVGLLGEERVKQLEQDLGAANKTLDALGVEAKAETPAPAPEAKPAEAAPVEKEKKDEAAWFLADMKPEEFEALLQKQVKPMLEAQQQVQVAAIVTATKAVGDKLSADLAQIVQAQNALDKRLADLEGMKPRGYRATTDPGTQVTPEQAKAAQPGPDGKHNEFLTFVLGQDGRP